jgi:hypothetical protein
MADALWVALLITVAIGMLVIAKNMEPHRSTPDGMSFTCRIQQLSTDGRGGGRWIEAKAKIVEGGVALVRRSLLRPRLGDDEPPRRVAGRAQGGPGRFAVYLLQGQGSMLALRVPAKSPAVRRLDELASPA